MQEVRKVFTLEDLKEALTLLENEKIEHTAKEKTFLHENIYTSNLTNKEYVILVANADVKKALDVFNNYYTSAEGDNSFLLQLEDEDLVEILSYKDNYSSFEIKESKAILTQRGVKDEEQKLLVRRRIANDNSPQKVKKNIIIGGYAFVLIGGVLGIAMGWYLYSSKSKHNVTGEKYKAHDNNSRFHGLIIFVLGIIFTLFYLVFGIDWWGYFIDL